MSKRTPAKTASLAATSAVNQALTYHLAAETAFRQGAFYAAMCGLTLKAIQQELGRGNWEDFHAVHFGDRLPVRTARYYMSVAEGLKLRVRREPGGTLVFLPSQAERDAFLAKRAHQATTDGNLFKLAGHYDRRFDSEIWELLHCAPSRLSEAQRTRLAAAVESIADGETMASLVEAYRLTKRPAGHGAAGGYKPDEARVQVYMRGYHPTLVGTLYAALPEEVQAGFRKWVAAGNTDETQLAINFAAPMFNTFEEPDFTDTVRKLPTSEKQRMLDHAEALVRCLREDLRRESRKAA